MKLTTKKIYSHLTDPKLQAVMKIQSKVLEVIHAYFRKEGFIEISPVIISPLTDPLTHPVYKSEINYEGQKLDLTKSMIFHKQLALMSGLKKIYCVSPNIRLEKSFEAKSRHLLEFQQIDFEISKGKKEDVYKLIDELFVKIIKEVKKTCSSELKLLKRDLKTPQDPFPIYKSTERISKQTTLYWLEDFCREFYDKEDSNYDLYYPEGFSEGLSGGERETDYKIVVEKMKKRKMDLKPYDIYLDLVKEKKIEPSAGAGFGVQRLLRYLTGERKIEKMCLFPRSPREKIIF